MSVIFYNIFLILFKAGTHIAALFNKKAKKWVAGRKNIFERLGKAISTEEKLIWIHCASLGEFEQGRPVIEKLKAIEPGYKILLTFFSPSGYEVQKSYSGADWVFYLPMDGPRNAKRFLEITKPSLVIFVKYEFWFYYLKKIKYRDIPLLLISANFRKDMSFFKWHGRLQRKMLTRFDHLFVQNQISKGLLDNIGLGTICSVSGDTRFDRVIEIAEKFELIHFIEKFIDNKKVIVAGSTWKQDEELLKNCLDFFQLNEIKLIIAPHEVDKHHILELTKLFPQAILYSDLSPQKTGVDAGILIVDSIGILSRLYNYGYACYVGGGFSRTGIHNVPEAAVYNKPVLFGPVYKKYPEAVGLVQKNGAFSINNKDELTSLLYNFILDPILYKTTASLAGNYIRDNSGAAKKIVAFIQEKRLLTN